MVAIDIRERLERNPFRPFRLVLSSGKSYDVRNPRLAVPMNRELFLALPDREHSVLIAYIHVASSEAINGAKRTRCRRA